MADQRAWHGTKKCAITGAKIPKAKQAPGQRCPWCTNTMGVYAGTAPTEAPILTTQQQLANLQRLHDDGLVTDEEYKERRKTILDEAVTAPAVTAPIPRPRNVTPTPMIADLGGKPIKRSNIVGGVVVGFIVVVVVISALSSGGSGGGATSRSRYLARQGGPPMLSTLRMR